MRPLGQAQLCREAISRRPRCQPQKPPASDGEGGGGNGGASTGLGGEPSPRGNAGASYKGGVGGAGGGDAGGGVAALALLAASACSAWGPTCASASSSLPLNKSATSSMVCSPRLFVGLAHAGRDLFVAKMALVAEDLIICEFVVALLDARANFVPIGALVTERWR